MSITMNDLFDSGDITAHIGKWFDSPLGTIIFGSWNAKLNNADFINPRDIHSNIGWTIHRDGQDRSDFGGHTLILRDDLAPAFQPNGLPFGA